MVGTAVLNIPGRDESYFFQANRYVVCKWTPGTDGDEITYGPADIHSDWTSLKGAGFLTIDAILPIPGQDNTAYFFSGSQYARIEYAASASASPNDKILGDVRTIQDDWKSLEKAGFVILDGALPVPGRPDEAYFFSGLDYCRVKLPKNGGDDELLGGPKRITGSDGWNLPEMLFDILLAIFPEPGAERGAFFFGPGQYCHLNVVVDGKDELVKGPADIDSKWPGLRKEQFY